jgi:hypothetical protein
MKKVNPRSERRYRMRLFRFPVSGFFLLLVFALQCALAGLPQPMCIYYGQAEDEYGWPYSGSHAGDVILRIGTNEIARHHVTGSLSPGVNFALYVPIDDGRGPAYVQNAAVTGATVAIVISDHAGERLVMETNSLPKVGKPGDVIAIRVTAGSDADHDLLPDEWERAVLYWSTNPYINSIDDLRPGDDLDGDGVSNWEEYLAGTLADDPSDYFRAEQGERTSNHCLRIQFYSVRGKIYQLFSTANLANGAGWQVCGFSTSEAGPWQLTPAEGDGHWMSLYAPISTTNLAFRMGVH